MNGGENSCGDNGRATAGRLAAVCAAIAALTVFAYLGAYYNDFVSLDDYEYLRDNAHVTKGITQRSVAWAFSSAYSSNWHPLTWISHMADWELYGPKPAGHHMTSVGLHAVNAVLLFLLLVFMTGFTGRSAMVALLFALHPLHVESVAWISERKDVLCAFFWFLTLAAYAWYAQSPSRKRFWLVAAGFACALMSKPMAVTLPLTLLLLDFWPLRRAVQAGVTPAGEQTSSWKALVTEKWPLYVLALASCVITLYAQKADSSVVPLDQVPLWSRAGNAAISCWQYILQMFWPGRLAVYYYHERNYLDFPFALFLAALLLLATLVFWLVRRKTPFCMTGWLWYLVTLVPVIGLVQVGAQARADRYTYIPLIGLFVMIVWGTAELVRRRVWLRRAALAGAAAMVAAMAATTVVQLGFWQNSVTLYRHAIEKDPRGWNINMMLSMNLFYQGKLHEAQRYFERAQFAKALEHSGDEYREFCRLQEQDSGKARLFFDRTVYTESSSKRYEVLIGMTEWCLLSGRVPDAESYGRYLVAMAPDSIKARLCLAQALLKLNKPADAEKEYREVLRRDTANVEAYNNLSFVLAGRQSLDEAIAVLRHSLAVRPGQPLACSNLGRVYLLKKRYTDAVRELAESVRLDPLYAAAHNDLGSALAGKGDLEEAKKEFRRALELDPQFEEARKNLRVLEAGLPSKPLRLK
jgi:protein O-mannosyl-transferase